MRTQEVNEDPATFGVYFFDITKPQIYDEPEHLVNDRAPVECADPWCISLYFDLHKCFPSEVKRPNKTKRNSKK